MKLELRHLAAYLPYKLKILRPDNETVLQLTGLNGNLLIFLEDYTEKYGHIRKNKPILRPLSDLTKKIEINGKEFIPLGKILTENFSNVININFGCSNYGYYAQGEKIAPKSIIRISYSDIDGFILSKMPNDHVKPSDYFRKTGNQDWMFEKLFEWHFDVFGLIDAGLAIDINSLND